MKKSNFVPRLSLPVVPSGKKQKQQNEAKKSKKGNKGAKSKNRNKNFSID